MSKLEYALQLLHKERMTQIALHAAGAYGATPADLSTDDRTRLAILVKEVGGVAQALTEDKHRDQFSQLLRVAAAAVAWMEYMTGNDEVITNTLTERELE